MAVVKANAYGHGVLRLADEAIRSGVEYLAVARMGEAMEIRRSGISVPILVFELTHAASAKEALLEEVDLTLCTVEGAKTLNAVAARLHHKAMIHVKVDTGMGRLGVWWKSAPAVIEAVGRMKWLELAGVYSHFATSEDPDQSFAREQVGRFTTVLEALQRRRIEIPLRHMANSGAIISLPESHLDLVRPGIMLYGYPPKREMQLRFPLKPVMSLVSRISFIKTVEAGSSISYGRRHIAASRTRIATVPLGYADGFSRLLTHKAEALINGARLPVVGAVTMDNVMVDLGLSGEGEVGTDVVFIGRSGTQVIDAWDISEKIGTIPYEVTCLVTPRVERMFVK